MFARRATRTKTTAAPTTSQTLRRVFLLLFLRGRTSRALQLQKVPRSVGTKLWLTLAVYAVIGFFAAGFYGQPVFALSAYLHTVTFLLVGMFVAASTGEMLFNKEEADILLHRPITASALLWSKVIVLVQISVWMAGAVNLSGLVVGALAPDGGWTFVPVHALSTVLSALFCTGCVVIGYQLCLRWFGRERLDTLMTTVQVLVSITTLLGSQLMPQFIGRFGGTKGLSAVPWWVRLLPPAWFAGIDDALSGSHARSSWGLGVLALGATAVVLWVALDKLAPDYGSGLQTLNETAMKRRPAQRRWVDVAVKRAPLKWWLTDSAARASFLLTAAYLLRDRETKLRVYPGIAPMLVWPVISLIGPRASVFGSFGLAFTGIYLGIIPLMVVDLMRYSQQYQAADLFRAVPIVGPAPLCHGVRRAVLFVLTLPAMAAFGVVVWVMESGSSRLALLLPGIVALPVYAMIPCMHGKAVPLALSDQGVAKAARRGLNMMGVMLGSMAWAGIMSFAWTAGWFWPLLLVEVIACAVMYVMMRGTVTRARWPAVD